MRPYRGWAKAIAWSGMKSAFARLQWCGLVRIFSLRWTYPSYSHGSCSVVRRRFAGTTEVLQVGLLTVFPSVTTHHTCFGVRSHPYEQSGNDQAEKLREEKSGNTLRRASEVRYNAWRWWQSRCTRWIEGCHRLSYPAVCSGKAMSTRAIAD